MTKPIIKCLFVAMLVAPPAFADDTLSTFHQQGDIDYPEPIGEESYFAEKAPMLSESSKYIGINFGVNSSSLGPEVRVGTKSGSLQKKTAISYAAGMYGGYGTNFNHFYFGGELSGYYNLLDKKINGAVDDGHNIDISVKQPITVNFDLIPGYLTQSRNVLFYGRFGLGLSLIKLGFTDITKTTATNPVSDKVNKFSFGLRAGLGLEYFMSDSFGLRVEYIYSSYNKVNGDDRKLGIPPTAYFYKLNDVGVHQVNLGLSIHF